MNLPNQITTTRFLMATVLFALLSQVEATDANRVYFFDISLGLFIVAALTDILDGYLARKYNLETIFGRIADPFVDKILVGGTFIFLIQNTPLVRPWMVVVIIGREFLISSVRGYAESQGIAFSANIWGKIKTILQCVTITAILFYLAHGKGISWAPQAVTIMLWGTVLITLLSGASYLLKAKKLWGQESK